MKKIFSFLLWVLVVDYSVCIKRKTIKLPPDVAGILLKAVTQCTHETGVPSEGLYKAYKGDYSEDEKFKNFIHCCFKNAGYLTLDGHVDIEKYIKIYKNEPEVADAAKKCGEETAINKKDAMLNSTVSNDKDAVFNFFKCLQDTAPVTFTL